MGEDFIQALLESEIHIILAVIGGLLILLSFIKVKDRLEIEDNQRRTARGAGALILIAGIALFLISHPDADPGAEPISRTEANPQSRGTPIPDASSDYEILFVENFSSNDREWPVGEIETSDFRSVKRGIENRVYHWELSSADAGDSAVWSVPVKSEAVSDFKAEVVVFVRERSDYVRYGLLFRYTRDAGYYVFYIDDVKGLYGVSLFLDGNWSRLMEPKYSSGIDPNKPNRLGVIGLGNQFELYVNERKVDEFTNGQFSEGQVGLAVSILPAGESAMIEFDNFQVSIPKDG
jgi:hypothetical protein